MTGSLAATLPLATALTSTSQTPAEGKVNEEFVISTRDVVRAVAVIDVFSPYSPATFAVPPIGDQADPFQTNEADGEEGEICVVYIVNAVDPVLLTVMTLPVVVPEDSAVGLGSDKTTDELA